MEKCLRFAKSRWFMALVCFIFGALVILGVRFVTYKPAEGVHYHANFALYINGQREQFKGPQYYEESAMCSANAAEAMTPAQRVHMHDKINNVVHVEDHAVTWGEFFANLGWTVGPDFIEGNDGTMYAANGTNKLNLILNGKNYTGLGGLTNTVIKDEDRLLVSYGGESDTSLQLEYRAIPSSAHHYDVTPDPDSCSGHSGVVTMRDRLSHLF